MNKIMFTKPLFMFFLCMALSLCASTVNAAENSGFRGEAALGTFLYDSSGSHSFQNGQDATSVDIENGMNISDETSFQGRIKLEGAGGIPGVYLHASYLESEGENRMNEVQYGDMEFTDTEDTSTELNFTNYDLTFFYSLKGVSAATLGRVKVDFGATLRYFEAQGSLSQVNEGSVTASFDDYAFAFYADILARPVENLELALEWKGFSFSDDEFSNITARVTYQFMDPFFAGGGYIIENNEIDREGFKLDMDNEGVFLEAGIRF
ncbi:MAG: TIGR04219 family outer membrane beta-barrel protein [Thermodesulfobacteriota bacterium]